MNPTYDTPIGTSGKINTKTGQIITGAYAGQKAPDAVTLGNFTRANPGLTPDSQDMADMTGPISASSLTPTGSISLPPASPSTGVSSALGYIGSLNDGFTKNLADQAAADRANTGDSFQNLIKGLNSTTGEAGLTDAAYSSTVDPLSKEVAGLSSQITAEQVGARHAIEQLQANPGGLSTGALASKVSDINRDSLSRQADLAVILAAKNGQYGTAKAIADRAVTAKLEQDKQRNDNLQFIYEQNKDLFDKSEQRAFESAQADRTRALDEAQYKERARFDEMIKRGDPLYKAQLANAQSANETTPSNTTSTYTLQAGDDPNAIAQGRGIDMAALQQLNPQVQDWHNLPVGYKLNLPLPAGQLSTNPDVDAYAQGILNGSVTSIAQVPKQYKTAVQTALNQPGQNGYSPLASSRFAMASNRIVNNYIALPQYQLTANGLPYLQRIQAAKQTPGSVSDQDLLDSLTKLNTSGNAITDAQVKLITGNRSFADAANVFKNKIAANGGALSENQRQQIVKIADAIYDNYKSGYQPVYDQATAQLKASGIPEAFWTIPDLNKLNIGPGSSASQSAAGGTMVTAPDGTKVLITD